MLPSKFIRVLIIILVLVMYPVFFIQSPVTAQENKPEEQIKKPADDATPPKRPERRRQPDGKRIPGSSRVEPLPEEFPLLSVPLGEVPETGVTFAVNDTFLMGLYNAAEAVCYNNEAHYPPPLDMDILIEGSGYIGAWIETQPMGGYMWGKRNLQIARNNQMIFILNQGDDGQIAYRINTDSRKFGGLQGYCFPTPAWELYFLLKKDKNYLELLYNAFERHEAFLWKSRDNDNNGCLEALSFLDTGEDGCTRWPEDRSKLPAYYESMDVMSYAYNGERIMAQISAELENGKADFWMKKSETTRRKVIDYLWIPEKHACYDRGPDNEFMDVLIHNNLRCMYHGVFTQHMADAFIKNHLLNPDEFWTPMPLVSIAANDPKFKSVPWNNWSGQPQGLTFQRAVRALENYGHYAEVTLIADKLLPAVGEERIFTQQFDPITGKPNIPKGQRTSSYGPTALAVLQYIAHLYGIEFSAENNEVWFSGMAYKQSEYTYTQQWDKHVFTLQLKNGRFDGTIDGKKIFTCSANVRVVTDMEGNLLKVVGISPETQQVTLEWGGKKQNLTVSPNQVYCTDAFGALVLESAAPFDYPFTSPEGE